VQIRRKKIKPTYKTLCSSRTEAASRNTATTTKLATHHWAQSPTDMSPRNMSPGNKTSYSVYTNNRRKLTISDNTRMTSRCSKTMQKSNTAPKTTVHRTEADRISATASVTASKLPLKWLSVSVSANVVSAKFPLHA